MSVLPSLRRSRPVLVQARPNVHVEPEPIRRVERVLRRVGVLLHVGELVDGADEEPPGPPAAGRVVLAQPDVAELEPAGVGGSHRPLEQNVVVVATRRAAEREIAGPVAVLRGVAARVGRVDREGLVEEVRGVAADVQALAVALVTGADVRAVRRARPYDVFRVFRFQQDDPAEGAVAVDVRRHARHDDQALVYVRLEPYRAGASVACLIEVLRCAFHAHADLILAQPADDHQAPLLSALLVDLHAGGLAQRVSQCACLLRSDVLGADELRALGGAHALAFRRDQAVDFRQGRGYVDGHVEGWNARLRFGCPLACRCLAVRGLLGRDGERSRQEEDRNQRRDCAHRPEAIDAGGRGWARETHYLYSLWVSGGAPCGAGARPGVLAAVSRPCAGRPSRGNSSVFFPWTDSAVRRKKVTPPRARRGSPRFPRG